MMRTRTVETPGMIFRAGESYTVYQEQKKEDLKQVSSSRSIADFLRNEKYFPFINSKELIYAMCLNRRHQIIGVEKLGEGGVSGTVADLKQLFAAAILCKASAVVMAHNHPSGTLYPSTQDKNLTNQVKGGLKLLDVVLLDHVIMTRDGYYSFADEGLI